MPKNYQQTVDLREKIEKQKKLAQPKPPFSQLEEIYGQEAVAPNQTWQKLNRPKVAKQPPELIKLIVFILAIMVVSATAYFLFFRSKGAANNLKRDWYAVKQADGMVYYGQIFDLKANPVAIKNVYYDYDRKNSIDQKKPIVENKNIRLVKLGQETQGGDGSILVYPGNGWPVMEPMKADSQVLKAILEYEK